MKNSHVAKFCLWMLISLFFSTALTAQVRPSLFVVVDFMKVQPQNHMDYLEVEQKIWKPMHQERINQGIIAGWFLYTSRHDAGGDHEADIRVTGSYKVSVMLQHCSRTGDPDGETGGLYAGKLHEGGAQSPLPI